jgi:DUF917 family protein
MQKLGETAKHTTSGPADNAATVRQMTAISIDTDRIPALARGCAVLGAGGGGDPLIGSLMAREAVLTYGPVDLVDLDDLPPEGLVMPCGFFGAPTVAIEKLENGGEGQRLVAEVEAHFGRPVVAIMPYEIGGSNGVIPLTWAARLGLPYVDADGMGRAFPTVLQMTMGLAGVPWSPSIFCDERFNTVVIRAGNVAWTERLLRSTASALGGAGVAALYLMEAKAARSATVRGSVSRALRLGAAILAGEGDPVTAVAPQLGAIELIRGSVTQVERATTGGFVRGSTLVEQAGPDGRLLRLEIQNENLVALEEGEVRASVPDIITVLDAQSGEVIVTERLRYGQRVSVIAFPCDPVWRTPEGLRLAGPQAFGYDLPYVPVELARVGTA